MRPVVPRAACVGAVVISFVLAPGETPADDAEGARTEEGRERISECVSYEQSVYDDGMRFRLESACEAEISCSLQWTLHCEGGRERREGAAFNLDNGAARSVRASAAACRDRGWRIDGVRWQCRSR
jgi:hypothetical protein